MARLVFDGNYHVYWLDTSPAAPAAPTVAEIEAGTDLTAFIPKDGVAPGVSNNRIDGGDLSTLFDAEDMGTWKSQLAITAYKDDDSDDAWDAFGDVATTGAIVICPFGAAAADAKCYVWPDIKSGAPMLPTSATNERQKFTAEFAVRAEPQFHAAVHS